MLNILSSQHAELFRMTYDVMMSKLFIVEKNLFTCVLLVYLLKGSTQIATKLSHISIRE